MCSTRSCRIVREEQNRAGAIELLMPTIQSAELWRESGRYDAYGKEMLRIKDRHERDMLYGPTNEEMITEIFRAYVRSYRDLPLNLYHIQWKFRDEVRPRFGLMRGREFLMKDAYSFDLDQAGAAGIPTTRCSSLICARSRALGFKAIPMRRRHRADRRQAARTSSSSSPTLARARCSATATISIYPVPDENVDFRQRRDGAGQLVDKWTSLYAATSDMHDAAAFATLARRTSRFPRAASRSATSSISAPNIPSR